MLLEGFQSGLIVQLINVALNRGADLIVAQSGVSNFIASRSLLPQLNRQMIAAGRVASAAWEIVIDESLAVLYDLNIGDPFIVADFEFRVSDIAKRASALFTMTGSNSFSIPTWAILCSGR